jgi:pyruvate/2-oxoacid:ferredoxin oxidoreductase beta subunit
MSFHGKIVDGKKENRKEIANICMMHKDVYVAQTTCAHPNHFYKAIMEANAYPGPAIVNVFTTCQPEHGVADNMAEHQAKLAADSRSFPVLIYDPRKGNRFKERLSLVGNPNVKEDWYVNPKTGEVIDFIYFARTEGRFQKHFDKDGNPSETLKKANAERLENWNLLQDLAGVK